VSSGNLFPFITPNYVGGLEEIGTSVAVTDMLLITAGQGNRSVLRLFPVWRNLGPDAGPASFTGLRAKVCASTMHRKTSFIDFR